MTTHHITGPTGSGKTQHLNKIAAAAQAKCLHVLGPLSAHNLQEVLVARKNEKGNQPPLASVVLLVDEVDHLTAAERHALEITTHLGWYQVFIAQTGARNQWENLA